MDGSSTESITQLLSEWGNGNERVENVLIEELYPHIHKIAHLQQLKYNNPNSMQTTEVVHEAFIKLYQQKQVDWQSKGHFLAISSKVVRRIIVDHFRAEQSLKKGGAVKMLTLDRIAEYVVDEKTICFDWLEMDRVLKELQTNEPASAKVVELKIFGGLSVVEIAEVLGVSVSTVTRNWRFAKSWLLTQLSQ